MRLGNRIGVVRDPGIFVSALKPSDFLPKIPLAETYCEKALVSIRRADLDWPREERRVLRNNRGGVGIATERSRKRRAVRIRAEALDRLDVSAAQHAWQGFDPVPAEGKPVAEADQAEQAAALAHAKALAEKADGPSCRVETAPDGTVSIIVEDKG